MEGDDPLRGRVALVTGAARGIGLASATSLAAAGAALVVSDVDEQELLTAAEALGPDVEAVVGDLTAPEIPDLVVERALSRWRRVDIVFNNAGYNWDAPIVDMTDEQFQAMLDVHVVAPFRILRAVGPHFREAAEADRLEGREYFRKVINCSSVSGTMGNANQANYNAAKAAVIGLTKGLAREWGDWRVNVNAIAPGFIDTRLTSLEDDAGVIDVSGRTIRLGIPASHRSKGSEHVALGRPGTVDEIASVVAFLASPASDYVTGQVISINGGLALGMSS